MKAVSSQYLQNEHWLKRTAEIGKRAIGEIEEDSTMKPFFKAADKNPELNEMFCSVCNDTLDEYGMTGYFIKPGRKSAI